MATKHAANRHLTEQNNRNQIRLLDKGSRAPLHGEPHEEVEFATTGGTQAKHVTSEVSAVNKEQQGTTSVLGLFLRLFWMFLGNAALGVCALKILVDRGAPFTVADIVYGACVPLLIIARYLDITRFNGYTAYLERATMAHWRRYSLGLLLGAATVWLLLRGIVLIVG
jgi:hypothetical protein